MKEVDTPSVATPPVVSADPGDSDARLVQQVRDGDVASFGVLVRRYQHKVQRVAFRFLRDWATAEDVAQDAFLKAYSNLESFDASRRFGPWLFRIVVNLSLDVLRRTRRRREQADVSLSDDQPGAPDAPHDRIERHELVQQVHRVIEKIPIKYRTVLVLRDLEGFSCAEVAAIVKRREATVRWRLSQAREMFRRLWTRHTAGREHRP